MYRLKGLVVSAIALGSALGQEHKIHNARELIEFSNSVNSGTSYSGTTVYLDTDIDFNDEPPTNFTPIGKTSGNNFRGTFDGQGHVISNLKIVSTIQYTGLFGHAYGLTIRNFVLDKMCSVTSLYESGISHVGGVLGYCTSSQGTCTVGSVINMGATMFKKGSGNSYDTHISEESLGAWRHQLSPSWAT